jgi:hypothetical protein
MNRERDDRLAHARLPEVGRRLNRGITGLGERVAARINQPSSAHERQSGAADAVTLHRLAHDVVDRRVGDRARRRLPRQGQHVVALAEDDCEARRPAGAARLHGQRPVPLRHELVEDLLVPRTRQLVAREPVAGQIVAEDRGVVVVGRDRDLNGARPGRHDGVEAGLILGRRVTKPLHRPADPLRVVDPDAGVAQVRRVAVDRNARRHPTVRAGLRDPVVDRGRVALGPAHEPVSRQRYRPRPLFERSSEDRIVRGPGRRQEHRLEAGGHCVVERGLVTGEVDAVHRGPVGTGALDPDGRVALVAARAVDAQARHPVPLREEIVEVGLVIGARAVVVRDEVHSRDTLRSGRSILQGREGWRCGGRRGKVAVTGQ